MPEQLDLAESDVLADVLVALSALPHTMVWRHNSGALPDRRGRWVSFGRTGSGDVIGAHGITITPEMVGRTFGLAISVETKRPIGGEFSEHQQRFAKAWRRTGALYVPATSVREAVDGVCG